MSEFISSYIICYAIGYMLWIKPNIVKHKKIFDLLFYASLIVISTIRYNM